MKRLLVVFLVMTVALVGCGKKNEEQEFVFKYVDEGPSEDTDLVSTDNNSVVQGDSDSYVVSRYTKEGTIEISYDETGADAYSVEYSYDIPKINDNSDVANAINEEIYDMAKSSVEHVESILDGSAEEVYEPSFCGISYESYINEDILSIIVEYDASYSEWVEYKVYNYNLSTHEKVENKDLLEIASISKADFLSKAKKTFGALALIDLDDYINSTADGAQVSEDGEAVEESDVDSDIILTDEDKYRVIADFIECYSSTVGGKNINTDMPLYFDGDGNLCAVGLVSVPAGAGHYYHAAKLEDVNNSAMFKKYSEYVEKYYFDGFEKDCMGIFETEGFSASIVRKISLSNMSSEEVYLGFDSENTSVFTMQFYGADYSNVYTGTIKFDSIDENGIAYAYELTEKNGELLEGEEEPHSGKFYFNSYDYYDEKKEESILGATYTFIDGEDMLASDGYNVDFRKTFG
ncbi:MAG: hypothetical protein Q4D29_09845 [Lachnospiraceae bacterium]|nr:hypothetical protein [Lachnospiraceae bacterium]